MSTARIPTAPSNCAIPLSLPLEASTWRKSLQDARVDYLPYVKALAAASKTLVCSGDDAALDALRGIVTGMSATVPPMYSRLASAGPEAPALVDFIMSKDCPVSALADRRRQGESPAQKQDATKKPGG